MVNASTPARQGLRDVTGLRRASRLATARRRNAMYGYLFIAPLIVLFLLYNVYPLLRAFWLSFTNYRYLVPGDVQFVGIQNYAEALRDPNVWHGFWLGVEFILIYVPLSIGISLFVAVLVDRVVNQFLSGFYRSVYYLPVIMPGVVVYVLWQWMYGVDLGLINSLLVDTLHLPFSERPLWLASERWAIPSVAFMEVWRYLGYNVLLILVGLSSINRELYEAARIDGASEWQVVRRITLPLLKPTFLVLLVLKMRVFAVVEPMLVMEGVGNSLWTWGWYAYDQAFVSGNLRMGYASAVGHLGALIMTVFVYFQYRLFRTERD